MLARPDLSTGEEVALDGARMALMGLGVVWCYRAAARLKQPQWRFLGAVAAVWTVTMVDGLIDDLGDGRTAGFPSSAQYAFLVIGPLLIVALLMVGLPTVRWVGRLRVLAEACTVSPAVLFMGYTLAVNVLPAQQRRRPAPTWRWSSPSASSTWSPSPSARWCWSRAGRRRGC